MLRKTSRWSIEKVSPYWPAMRLLHSVRPTCYSDTQHDDRKKKTRDKLRIATVPVLEPPANHVNAVMHHRTVADRIIKFFAYDIAWRYWYAVPKVRLRKQGWI